MKCCVSTDVGTWRNWLTFEPDPDAGTGLLSPISYALQRAEFIASGKSHVQVLSIISRHPSQKRRVVLRSRKTVVGGKCALPSAVLVLLRTLRKLPYLVLETMRNAVLAAAAAVSTSTRCVHCYSARQQTEMLPTLSSFRVTQVNNGKGHVLRVTDRDSHQRLTSRSIHNTM